MAENENPNWWKDVLGSKDLLLAVRDGYFNAYANGQSVFRVGRKGKSGSTLDIKIHYKYLVRPSLRGHPEYVRFDGTSFRIDPSEAVRVSYDRHALREIISAAKRHAGKEKEGVREIASREPKVVDLEIAFSRKREGDKDSAPRMDLAVLVPNQQGDPQLVFCEAKCADNAELAGGRGSPPVVGQLAKYRAFIERNGTVLQRAYRNVCQALVAFGAQGWHRTIDDLIRQVAETGGPSVSPNVYLLVYGYGRDQKPAVETLLANLVTHGIPKEQIIGKGSAKQFELSKDIGRREAGVS